jgi:hypothetical protein
MEGGCTCGQVRYRLIGAPLIVHACHCSWCQRETGTVHALNALYEADRVEHIAGEPELIVTPSASVQGRGLEQLSASRTGGALRACRNDGRSIALPARHPHLYGVEVALGRAALGRQDGR